MIVANQKYGASAPKQSMSIATEAKRIVDVLHRLEARDQLEARVFELRCSKRTEANEALHVRRCRRDRSRGRFDAHHVGDAKRAPGCQPRALAASDVEDARRPQMLHHDRNDIARGTGRCVPQSCVLLLKPVSQALQVRSDIVTQGAPPLDVDVALVFGGAQNVGEELVHPPAQQVDRPEPLGPEQVPLGPQVGLQGDVLIDQPIHTGDGRHEDPDHLPRRPGEPGHEPLQLLTYECDGLPHLRCTPALVVLPSSAAQVQAVVRLCNREGVPFVARGHGTGLSGGALPTPGSVVIALSRLNRLLDVDIANRRVTLEPGVTNLEITRAVSLAVSVPVVASGGAGKPEHLADAIQLGRADAALAASIFHFGEYTIHQTKAILRERGIPVRGVA